MCSRSLRSSLLLQRKLLQLFAESNVPLISCQLLRAEPFLAAGSPPSSPPPSPAEQEPLSFQHLEVWSACLGFTRSPSPVDLVPAMLEAFPSEAQRGWLSLLPAGHRSKEIKRQEVVPAFLQCLLFFAGGCINQSQGRWMCLPLPVSCLTANPHKVDFSWAFWQKKQF